MFANVFAKALRACRLHPMVPAALQFGCSDSLVIANSCLKMLTQHAHNDDLYNRRWPQARAPVTTEHGMMPFSVPASCHGCIATGERADSRRRCGNRS